MDVVRRRASESSSSILTSSHWSSSLNRVARSPCELLPVQQHSEVAAVVGDVDRHQLPVLVAAEVLVGAGGPENDPAFPVLPRRDRALEVRVLHRVVLGGDGQALLGRGGMLLDDDLGFTESFACAFSVVPSGSGDRSRYRCRRYGSRSGVNAGRAPPAHPAAPDADVATPRPSPRRGWPRLPGPGPPATTGAGHADA